MTTAVLAQKESDLPEKLTSQTLDRPKFLDQQRLNLAKGVPFAVVGLKTYATEKDEDWIGIRFGDELATRLGRLSSRFAQVERLYLHELIKVQGLRQAVVSEEEQNNIDKIRTILASSAPGSGRFLGAHWLIVGSVRVYKTDAQDKRVRVNVRLDKVTTGEILGAWTTTGALEQIDELIGESAVEMARAMGANLTTAEKKELRAGTPLSGLAREAYDQANVAFDHGDYEGAQQHYWQSWRLSGYRFHEAISRYGECWKLLPGSAALAIEEMEDQLRLGPQASGSIGLVLAQIYFAGKAEGKFTRPVALKYLATALKDGNETVRQQTLQMINVYRINELAEETVIALEDPSRPVRIKALDTLESLQIPLPAEALIRLMENEEDVALVTGVGYRLSTFPKDENISLRIKRLIEGLQAEDIPALRKRVMLLLAGAYYFIRTDGDYALSLAEEAEASLRNWEALTQSTSNGPPSVSHADRANVYWGLAFCFEHKPSPDLDQALVWYQRALHEEERGLGAGDIRAETLGGTYADLARCMSKKTDPDWGKVLGWSQKAVDEYEKAVNNGMAKPGNLGWVYYQLGWTLHHQPKPDWNAALAQYQRAEAAIRKGIGDGSATHQDLGHIYQSVGRFLHSQPQPAWEKAMESYGQAAIEYRRGLLDGSAKHGDLGRVYFQLGWCSHNRPEPDWKSAFNWYKQASQQFEESREDHISEFRDLGYTLETVGLLLEKNSSWYQDSLKFFFLALEQYKKAFQKGRDGLETQSVQLQPGSEQQAIDKSSDDLPCIHQWKSSSGPISPQILSTYTTMIVSAANALASGTGTDPVDLYTFGKEGLERAYHSYDPDQEINFRPFAVYRVRQAILNGLNCKRNEDHRRWEQTEEEFRDRDWQELSTAIQDKVKMVVDTLIEKAKVGLKEGSETPEKFEEKKKRAAELVSNSATIYLLSLGEKELLQNQPSQINWVSLGWFAYLARDIAKAVEYTLTALYYEPTQPSALYNLGLLQTEENDLTTATATYAKALQADADQVLLAGIQDLQDAITRTPSIASFHYALGLLLEARAAEVAPPERETRLAEARAAYEAYLANAQDPAWRAKGQERIEVLKSTPMVGLGR